MADLRAYAREAARRAGTDPELFVRQIDQESGFNPKAYNAGSGASGIAQIVERFHPGVDVWDAEASLDYAAAWMADLRRRLGSYRRALAAYNWGPGNVAKWDGERATLPAETRRYLDVILGPGWPEPGEVENMPGIIRLSEVLARGRSRIGDPYVWDGERPGAFDCSGFVRWCYDGKLTSFTDAILGETERVETPAPGDVVLYEYRDASQPGVRFPHVGLFVSDGVTLDARFGRGVGEHEQLPRSQATRYYRRLPGVVVDTDATSVANPPPPAPDPRVAELEAQVAQLTAERDQYRAQLDEARTHLGVITVDYAQSLENLLGAIRALRPAA